MAGARCFCYFSVVSRFNSNPICGAAAVLFLIASCATRPPPQSEQAIFDRPQDFVGRTVRVCGYSVSPFNVQQADPRTSDAAPVGLDVLIDEPEPGYRRGRRCVTGTVERTGCGVEMICIRYTFEYAVRPGARD